MKRSFGINPPFTGSTFDELVVDSEMSAINSGRSNAVGVCNCRGDGVRPLAAETTEDPIFVFWSGCATSAGQTRFNLSFEDLGARREAVLSHRRNIESSDQPPADLIANEQSTNCQRNMENVFTVKHGGLDLSTRSAINPRA